ncbi:MAG TPA: UvrB/UvrC motif-containing protein [Isosphaeraceae bacterium]|nr:UvrB/UvrC motif-containing protein [Isosphaeraceae bacterium]
MICQRCKNNASVHLTQRVGESRQELHLCLACAQKAGLAVPENPPDLALDAVVQSLIVAHVGELVGELADLSCPDCGIKYMEFRAGGRLGCPQDYRVFSRGLLPVLQRVHGATRHVGKSARQRPGAINRLRLRSQLREAILHENYEEAARIRDELRLKDTNA